MAKAIPIAIAMATSMALAMGQATQQNNKNATYGTNYAQH